MDTDKFRNFIAIGLILYACVNVLMKFMPNIATQLPLPVYEFFYSITVNTEPGPPTESFSQEVEPNSS
jgi:sugar phosphate permease